MTATHNVRVTGPGDLLALVPSVLGFHPEDSVVLLTVGNARQPFHARVDLPTDAEQVDLLAAHLTEVASRGAVTQVAVVVYTDDGSVARAVVDALDEELLRAGIDLVCVVRADGERCWVLDSLGETGGTRYDTSSHPLMAQAVLEGTVVLGSRRELAESLVGNDPHDTEEIAALADDALQRLSDVASAPLGAASWPHQMSVESRWVRARVQRFLEDGQRLSAADVARLVVVVTAAPGVRDVAWAEMSRADADRHVDLWRDLVRRCPVHMRAVPATLLGFAAWLSGHGALAWCAVEKAHEADPGQANSMIGLVERILSAGMPPSSWQPMTPDELRVLDG
jgi:hypothetical protein